MWPQTIRATKAVAAQFDRMFTRSDVTFVGNTRIGVDIDIAAITESFDIVVAATGPMSDRELTVPQQDGAQIIGCGRHSACTQRIPRRGSACIGDIGEAARPGLWSWSVTETSPSTSYD